MIKAMNKNQKIPMRKKLKKVLILLEKHYNFLIGLKVDWRTKKKANHINTNQIL